MKSTSKQSHWWLTILSLVFLLAGLTACSSGGDGEEKIPDEVVVDEKPNVPMELGDSEEFDIDEDNCTVYVGGTTIDLNPCIVGEGAKLTVSKTTQAPWMISENDNVTAVSIKIGDLNEFDGVAKIRIPVNFGPGKVLVGAQWNESDKDWEPALCEYDKIRGEAVIWADGPGTYGVTVVSGSAMAATRAGGSNSTFGAFIVARANTRDAGILANKFHYVDWEDPPLLVMMALKSKLFGGDNALTKEADVIAEGILDTKALFGDITYPLISELGFGRPLLDKTCDFMGKAAVVATFYQKLRAIYSGETDKADAMELKAVLEWFVDQGKSLCASSAMNLGMVAVAIFDYTLNKFAETAWKGRKDLYKQAFNLYYSKDHAGYRSFRDWYDLFWPAFIKKGMTEYRLNTLIDAYVNQHCEKIWDDEEELALELSEIGLKWSAGGGLNKNMQKEISEEYREYLYNDTSKLPKVFEAIGEKLVKKQYDIMKDRMMEYAFHMNEMVTLHLKDISANNKSAFAGYTVKFKRMPLSIIDPEKWTCELNEKGEGDIKFRLFGYVAAGVRPELVIISPDGKEVMTLNVEDLDVGKNIVNYDSGSQDLLDVSPQTLAFEFEGGTQEVKITKGDFKNCGADVPKTYETWLSAQCSDDGTVTITARPNMSFEERKGEVTCWVSNVSDPQKTVNVSITQAPVTGVDWNPKSLSFSANGGSEKISFDFGGFKRFGAQVHEEGFEWCGVSAANGKLTITVQPNPSTESRECIVDAYVTNSSNPADDEKLIMPITVFQEGGDGTVAANNLTDLWGTWVYRYNQHDWDLDYAVTFGKDGSYYYVCTDNKNPAESFTRTGTYKVLSHEPWSNPSADGVIGLAEIEESFHNSLTGNDVVRQWTITLYNNGQLGYENKLWRAAK